jgi:hypothetical protein
MLQQNCRYPYTGENCDECVQGYQLNNNDECVRDDNRPAPCKCDPRGSVSTTCNNGVCQCKVMIFKVI